MLRRVDRILIRVPQLESAGRYYQDVLGMTLVRQDQRLATFRCADEPTEIVLHTDPDLPEQGVYFLVEDVRALHAKRTQLKLTFIAGPTPVSRGFLFDIGPDPFLE